MTGSNLDYAVLETFQPIYTTKSFDLRGFRPVCMEKSFEIVSFLTHVNLLQPSFFTMISDILINILPWIGGQILKLNGHTEQ